MTSSTDPGYADDEPDPSSGPRPEALVVGAGPAGVSAALWLQSQAVPFEWVTRDGRIGGILHRVENAISNYPGGYYDNGRELAEQMRRHVADADVEGPREAAVESLERRNGLWHATFESARTARFPVVVLATGTRYRRLGVPGESDGLGDYVSQSTARDAETFGGRTVAIVGGGDAGFEGALQLAEAGSHVHMLLRSESFKARPQFVEPVREHPRIFIHPIPTVVTRIEQLDAPRGCRVRLDVQGEPSTIEVGCLFVRIGVDPNVPALEPTPETKAGGYLQVDPAQRTSVDGLLAAGEVTDPALPAVATAVGDGADAARTAAEILGYTAG